jgi:tripartite-type tricarboxylate transporter receptor subunit TctC
MSSSRLKEDAMTMMRRQFLCLAAAAAGTPVASNLAWALSYPTRPVRIIVPAAAGGPSDVIGRIMAHKLGETWGQPFHVENLPAGAANVGTAVAAKAAPDGHTLIVISSSFVINPSLNAKLAYDPIKDFAPVTLVAVAPNVVTVNPALPVRSIRELIALLKANPGKYSYASAGAGQSGHLAGELFKLRFGLDLVHVPFNGGAGAMTATIGGHTQVAFNALPTAAQIIKDGKLRALAVTSAARAPEFPDVPTLAEAGVPDQESVYLQGIVAPAGTPKEIVSQLNREIVRTLAMPDVAERLAAIGFYPVGNSPEEFAIQIRNEIAKWGKVIHDANIGRVE